MRTGKGSRVASERAAAARISLARALAGEAKLPSFSQPFQVAMAQSALFAAEDKALAAVSLAALVARGESLAAPA